MSAPRLQALGVQLAMARRKARMLARSLPEVPEEWRAAVVLYTMESRPPTTSIYHMMNSALRDQSRQLIRVCTRAREVVVFSPFSSSLFALALVLALSHALCPNSPALSLSLVVSLGRSGCL